MDDGLPRETNNCQRLVQVPLGRIEATALRLVPEETWGETEEARVFGFEPLAEASSKLPQYPDGPAKCDPKPIRATSPRPRTAWKTARARANAALPPSASRRTASAKTHDTGSKIR